MNPEQKERALADAMSSAHAPASMAPWNRAVHEDIPAPVAAWRGLAIALATLTVTTVSVGAVMAGAHLGPFSHIPQPTVTAAPAPVVPTPGASSTAKPRPSASAPISQPTAHPTPRPTAAPTPVPASPPASSCALTAAAEACWAAHTGVPGLTEAQILGGSTHLRHVVGDQTITADGTVIHDEWIDGCIAVKARNVTIYNVLIRTSDRCTGGDGSTSGGAVDSGGIQGPVASRPSGLLLHDVEIDGQGAEQTGLLGVNMTCLRCNLHGMDTGVFVITNLIVRDSYIRGAYNDVSYNGGGAGLTLTNDWMKTTATSGGVNGAVVLLQDWPGGGDVTVSGCYLEGGLGADLVGGGAKTANEYFNVVVTNNAFSPHNGYGGTDFVYYFDSAKAGNVWSGNFNSVTHAEVAPG